MADRLDTLLAAGGRGLYDPFDRQARDLLDRGRAAGDAGQIEDVARFYPSATVVPEAWLALARLHDEARRPSDAARAYKHLLHAAADDSSRGRALWGLARAYEAQRLWVPAREMLGLARSRHGEVVIDEPGTSGKLGALATARLNAAPFIKAGAVAEPGTARPPWTRSGGRRVGPDARVIVADGVPPSDEAPRAFAVEGTRLRPLDAFANGTAWTIDLGGEPLWAGYLSDRLILAGPRRLVALAVDTGGTAWQSDILPPAVAPGDPFAKPGKPPEPGGEEAGELHGFRVVGDRVYCLRGDKTLLALDGDSGLVDWSYRPAVGKIDPHLTLGPGRIVLLTTDPDPAGRHRTELQVLQTSTGRRLGSFPRGDMEEWQRDPTPLDDDRVALVVDAKTVVLFDLERGAESWKFRESEFGPLRDPPIVLAEGGALVVVHERELIRLDPRTGGKLWSCPMPADLTSRPSAMAVDSGRFYAACGNEMLAVGLADGAVCWKAGSLGPKTAGWSVALADRNVVAWPDTPDPSAADSASLPMLVRRRDTGSLVQRFLFPASPTGLVVRLEPGGGVVAAQGRLWALGDRRPVDAGGAPR